MKKYQLSLIFAFSVIIVLCLSVPTLAQMQSKELAGYLCDVSCATKK